MITRSSQWYARFAQFVCRPDIFMSVNAM